MLNRLKNIILPYVLNKAIERKRGQVDRYELYPVVKRDELPELTADEKAAVDARWGCLTDKINYDYFRLFKKVVGFSENYVPDDIFMPGIVRVLNPYPLFGVFQNKENYDTLFDALPQPKSVLKHINGVLYDAHMAHVTAEKATEILSGKSFIVKKTFGSCGGTDIAILHPGDDVNRVLTDYKDFICQELVEQSPLTARFNPSSLNTFRLTTINLDGKVTCPTIIFRHGRSGAIVDNGAAGGILCGVSTSGVFNSKALDKDFKVYETLPDGSKYGDITIPEVAKLVDLAVKSHCKYLTRLGIAGWDFALDKNGNPVFIEVNLGYPGIMLEQMCNSKSIFGDRLDEAIKYALDHKSLLTIMGVTANSLNL